MAQFGIMKTIQIFCTLSAQFGTILAQYSTIWAQFGIMKTIKFLTNFLHTLDEVWHNIGAV